VEAKLFLTLSFISIALLVYLIIEGKNMSEATDRLTAVVEEQTTVIESAIELINGIPALVGEAVREALVAEDAEDEAVDAAVEAATERAAASTAALRAALTENTDEEQPS
jgi:hypothetical protein